MKQVKKWVSLGVLVASLVILVAAVLGCGGTTATTAGSTETTSDAYDITAIAAGIKVDASLNAMLPAAIKADGIKVACDIPYQPWEMYVGDTEKLTGFDYDLGQALGAVLGVKVAFVKTAFESLIPSLQAGQNNIVMSAMYDNLKRRLDCDFVEYAWDGTSIMVLKGNPKGITGFAGLAGKTVGCERGTTQATMLENLNAQFKSEGKPEMTISQYDDQPTAFTALQSGRTDCDVTDSSTAAYNAINTDAGETFEVVSDPENPNGLDPTIVGIAVLKADTQLRDALQQALQKLIDDGTYTTIISQYGLSPVTAAEINKGTSSGE
jgi:polar amino acid transport system substrate-binding protein